MVLDFPGTKMGVRDSRLTRASWANHRRRCAVGPAEEVEPRLHQLTAATLSEPNHKLAGEVGVCVATRAAPRRRAANSKSLLVKVPEGLDADTSL
jgi:hypothetical protein